MSAILKSLNAHNFPIFQPILMKLVSKPTILKSLSAHNFPIFQPILMKLVSKPMVRESLYHKTYLLLELASPLSVHLHTYINQRTNGPVNAHLISWPSKAQNIQNLENIW